MTVAAFECIDRPDHVPELAADRSGNQESFTTLVLGQRRSLMLYAQTLTGDRTAADDLLQDTFERAFRGAWQFRPGSNLSAWLRRIMRNLFTDTCRVRFRFTSIEDQDAADRLMVAADREESPEADYRQVVTIDDVKVALESIDRPLRDIFVLAHLKRQTYQEIAVELGIPLSTVGSRLWRARARVRGRLAQQYGGAGEARS